MAPAAAEDDQAAAAAEARREARAAVARAAEAGAETYAPVVLREARDALQEGERLLAGDPQASAEALARAASRADAAYRNAVGAERQQVKLTLELLQQDLAAHQVDRFRPEEYAAAAAAAARVQELFAAGRQAEGAAAAQGAIRQLRTLRDAVAAQVARVLQLKGAAEALQDQVAAAAQADAAGAAELNDLYAQGSEALEERYALDEAERLFAAAEQAGRMALATDAPEEPAAEVMTTYTVRSIPERPESLWRIAGYDFIYGDPTLWPRIWQGNRELIQDPDLILPGWQLSIPRPQEPAAESPPAAP